MEKMMRLAGCLALAGSLFFAACSGSEESPPPDPPVPTCEQADVYERGMAKPGNRGQIQVAILDAEPAPPQVEVYNKLRVRVTDAAGAPMDDVTVVIDTFMPLHKHGATVPVTVTPLGNGEYELNPLYLFMGGYWEITVIVKQGSVETDRAKFAFCV
jgi:hypothetical protein